MIAYTYNEPTIFFEYMLDCAKLARKNKIKNVIVSNGFINPEPLGELLPFIDAANIDLKSFDDDFYKKICKARLEPVLKTLITISKSKTWLEVTNLIIPGKNDDPKKIKALCEWHLNNLGAHVPLHFSAFYPQYKMMDTPNTPSKSLIEAREIAMKVGLKYIYIGNREIKDGETTFCQNCRKIIIDRHAYTIKSIDIEDGKCRFCRHKIDGVFG